MARKRIGEILIEAGLLDQMALRRALREQTRWGAPLGQILVELKIVEEKGMILALSKQLRVPVVDVSKQTVSDDALALVPGEFAKEKQILPLRIDGRFLDLAMCDPTNLSIIDELRIRTHLNIRCYLVGHRAMAKAIERWYGIVDPDAIDYDPELLYARERIIEQVGSFPQKVDSYSPPIPTQDRDARQTSQPRTTVDLDRVAAVEKAVEVLQMRQSRTERQMSRDATVLRNLLLLLIENKMTTREEILEWIG